MRCGVNHEIRRVAALHRSHQLQPPAAALSERNNFDHLAAQGRYELEMNGALVKRYTSSHFCRACYGCGELALNIMRGFYSNGGRCARCWQMLVPAQRFR
jgi:hypothetical protein